MFTRLRFVSIKIPLTAGYAIDVFDLSRTVQYRVFQFPVRYAAVCPDVRLNYILLFPFKPIVINKLADIFCLTHVHQVIIIFVIFCRGINSYAFIRKCVTWLDNFFFYRLPIIACNDVTELFRLSDQTGPNLKFSNQTPNTSIWHSNRMLNYYCLNNLKYAFLNIFLNIFTVE